MASTGPTGREHTPHAETRSTDHITAGQPEALLSQELVPREYANDAYQRNRAVGIVLEHGVLQGACQEQQQTKQEGEQLAGL